MSSLNKFLATFVVVLCIADGVLLKQIPDYIKRCKRDPKTMNECVTNSIEDLRPKLVKGIPELEVPALDPFYISELVAIDGQNNQLSAIGRDVKVTGGGDFTIKSLSVDLDTLTIKVRVLFPKLHFQGNYELKTQILALPLNGKGGLVADAVKCDAEFTMRGELYKKDDREYLRFDKLDADININDYKVKLDGLFNGDKVLEQAANEALNQNRGDFLKATKPSLESTVKKLLLEIANKVVDDLPFDELFPKP